MEAACGESDAALHCCDVVDAGMATEARQHFVKVALNRVRVWVSAFVRVRAWLRTRLCMYACVCSYWHRAGACVGAWVRAWVRGCVRGCVGACVGAWVRAHKAQSTLDTPTAYHSRTNQP
jgi:hypothetical protein